MSKFHVCTVHVQYSTIYIYVCVSARERIFRIPFFSWDSITLLLPTQNWLKFFFCEYRQDIYLSRLSHLSFFCFLIIKKSEKKNRKKGRRKRKWSPHSHNNSTKPRSNSYLIYFTNPTYPPPSRCLRLQVYGAVVQSQRSPPPSGKNCSNRRIGGWCVDWQRVGRSWIPSGRCRFVGRGCR